MMTSSRKKRAAQSGPSSELEAAGAITRPRSWSLPRWGAASLLGLVLLVWFGPAIVLEQKIGYRDANHFYLPLYDYLSQRLRAGDFPLWNPLQLTGTPVVGDATSAMFYPVRAIFLLGMQTETALLWYCLLHLVWAAMTATYAARHAGVTSGAASLAGMAYALSAPVVEMVHNPPFLVGAAWLPLALSGLLQCAEGGSRRAIVVAVIGMTMPILGGDPQTTYHAVLIGMIFWIARWLRTVAVSRHIATGVRQSLSLRVPVVGSGRECPRLWPCVLACGLAFACGTLQILPTLQWSAHSNRAVEAPAGIMRWVSQEVETAEQGAWYQQPRRDQHAGFLYSFSVGPWNVLESFAPGVWGQSKPVNQRLSRAIDREEQYWTESVYCGLLVVLVTLLLAIHGRMNRWAWLAVFALWCATGRYGLVDGLQTLGGWLGQRWFVDWNPAIGSGYWSLVTFVPGYGTFRYPGKWLPVMVLGLSIAAAKGMSELDDRAWNRLRTLCKGLLTVSMLMIVVASLPWIAERLQFLMYDPRTIDINYGPLQVAEGLRDFRRAWLHAAAVCTALLLLGRRWSWQAPRNEPRWYPALNVLLAIDLLVAGTSWVVLLPRLRTEVVGLSTHEQIELQRHGLVDGDAVIRMVDTLISRAAWARTSSTQRFFETDFNEQRTMFGLWSLPHQLTILNATPSIVPVAHQTFWTAMQQHVQPMSDASLAWSHALAWMGAAYRLESGLPTLLDSRDLAEPLLVAEPLWNAIPATFPTVRWHDNVSVQMIGVTEDPVQIWKKVLPHISAAPAAVPLLLSDTEETQPPIAFEKPFPSQAPIGTAPWTLIHTDAQSARFDVVNSRPGWLYLHVFQDGNWRAEVLSREGETREHRVPLTANLVGQAIFLAPGKWQVHWYYTPTWLFPAIVFTILGWSGTAWLAWKVRWRTANPRSSTCTVGT